MLNRPVRKRTIRCILSPKSKKYVKKQMKKKRRKLLKQGLKDIKLAYNQGTNIEEIDLYNDSRRIKIEARKGCDADIIERRTTNSRLIVADCW